MMRSLSGSIAALASGALLWSIASLSAGGREAWDTPSFWTLWYPLALLISAVLGFLFADRPWRWPIVLMLAQLPVMAVASGEIANLAPLGAILLLILSLPGVIAAYAGAAMRRWVAV